MIQVYVRNIPIPLDVICFLVVGTPTLEVFREKACISEFNTYQEDDQEKDKTKSLQPIFVF